MKHTDRERLRKTWREMYQNYMKLRSTAIEILLYPEATAEHVMPAKDTLCEIHAIVLETQRKLEQLGVLGTWDPRLPKE